MEQANTVAENKTKAIMGSLRQAETEHIPALSTTNCASLLHIFDAIATVARTLDWPPAALVGASALCLGLWLSLKSFDLASLQLAEIL